MRKTLITSNRIWKVSLLLVCSLLLLSWLWSPQVFSQTQRNPIEDKSIVYEKEDKKITFATGFFGSEISLDNTDSVGGFVNTIIKIFFAFAGTALVLMIAIHGFKMIFNQFKGSVSDASEAKKKLGDAFLGIGILLFSWLFLNFVNPDLLSPSFLSGGNFAQCSPSDIQIPKNSSFNKTAKVLYIPGEPSLSETSSLSNFINSPEGKGHAVTFNYLVSFKKIRGGFLCFNGGTRSGSTDSDGKCPGSGDTPYGTFSSSAEIPQQLRGLEVEEVILIAKMFVTKTDSDGESRRILSCNSVPTPLSSEIVGPVKPKPPSGRQCVNLTVRVPKVGKVSHDINGQSLERVLGDTVYQTKDICLSNAAVKNCVFRCPKDNLLVYQCVPDGGYKRVAGVYLRTREGEFPATSFFAVDVKKERVSYIKRCEGSMEPFE